MQKKNKNKFNYILFTIMICITLIVISLLIAKDGIALSGIPNVDDVKKITLVNSKFPDEVKELKEREQLEIVANLSGLLNYSIFDNDDASEEADIIITYYLNSGKNVAISVNKNSVWLHNKKYSLKKDGIFVDVIEGIFYPDISNR